MKNTLKMKIIGAAALMLAAVLTTQCARAGFGGYAGYVITNQTVTAPTFVTNFAYVSLPAVTFTAIATNDITITTNSVIQGIPGTTYFNQFTFIYNSGTYGTNFTTNFPAYSFVVTNITGFQSVPQSQGTTNMVQETFN